ncbi:MAG: DUF368 domain-containing protein [Myxococcota bacterium]
MSKEASLAWWSIAARGFVMGAADVVPGVSGGTMALILGIYPRLISSLSLLNPALIWETLQAARGSAGRARARAALHSADIPFLASLALGIAGAVLSLSRIIPGLMRAYPEVMNGFFFGLILASVLIPYRMMQRRGFMEIILFGVGAIVAYVVTGLGILDVQDSLPFLFLSGAIAICAMLLPGVSGAFLLLILGQYTRVLDALHERNLVILLVFVAGVVTGLLSFSRVLRYLLDRHRDPTLAGLCGLMVGSLQKIWPFKIALAEPVMVGHKVVSDSINVLPSDPRYTGPLLLPLAMTALGFLAVLVLEQMGRRRAESPQADEAGN